MAQQGNTNKEIKMVKSIVAALVAVFAITSVVEAREIRIVGSSTVYPFTTIVGETFAAEGNTAPVIESTGTGGGMKLFCAGVGDSHPDFTNASRAIKSSEVEKCKANGITPLEMMVGYDGIVFANSKASGVLEITPRELFQALAKDVPQDNGNLVPNPFTTWNQINPKFPNVKIEVLGPPPSSGTRDAWSELVMEKGCKTYDWVKAMKKKDKKAYKGICHGVREDGAYIEAGENDNLIIQKLANNPNAFGVFGYSFLDQNTDVIQGSPISGVVPTFESIADGSYPASRGLYVYAKKEHMGVIPGMTEFMELYLSDDIAGADGSLGDAGLIPLPQNELDTVRANVLN
jgi:phosphate transport system substrate-binding protein